MYYCIHDDTTEVILCRHLNIKSLVFLLMIFPPNDLLKVQYFYNRRWNIDHQWFKLWHIQLINYWRHGCIHRLYHHDNSNRYPANHAARELPNQTLGIQRISRRWVKRIFFYFKTLFGKKKNDSNCNSIGHMYKNVPLYQTAIMYWK